MAYVVVRDQHRKVLHKLALQRRPLLVGRAPDCDLQIPDTQISRHHCQLIPTPKGWIIKDLQSRNGTRVEDRPVQEHLLRDGDIVQLSAYRLTFFAANRCHKRASDPVVAGLVDAESVAGVEVPPVQDFAPSESSLFATCVVPMVSDDSTVVGARAALSSESSISSSIPSTNAPKNSILVHPALIGAAVLGSTFVIIWLYFVG